MPLETPLKTLSLSLTAGLLFAASSLGACATTGDVVDHAPVPSTATVVTGTVVPEDGKALPAGGLKIVAIWGVSAASPDYAYKFGETNVAPDGTFRLVVDAATLPQDARNRVEQFSFAVGLVAAVPANTVMPDGRLPQNDAKTIIGNARQIGLIVRHGKIPERIKGKLSWPGAFPNDRAKCGRGMKVPDARFDAFKPTSCKGVKVQIGPIKWVNWT